MLSVSTPRKRQMEDDGLERISSINISCPRGTDAIITPPKKSRATVASPAQIDRPSFFPLGQHAALKHLRHRISCCLNRLIIFQLMRRRFLVKQVTCLPCTARARACASKAHLLHRHLPFRIVPATHLTTSFIPTLMFLKWSRRRSRQLWHTRRMHMKRFCRKNLQVCFVV